MPTGHVADRSSAGPFSPQVPQVGCQVSSLDDSDGVLDGLLRGSAVILGGEGAHLEVDVGPVGVRRVQGDQVGKTVAYHLHAVPGVVAGDAVEVGLDLAGGEGVLHAAALLLLELADAAPADEAKRALVELENLVSVDYPKNGFSYCLINFENSCGLNYSLAAIIIEFIYSDSIF